jgi:raffinose/stachyose/melibiose transport system substrate-binding protein
MKPAPPHFQGDDTSISKLPRRDFLRNAGGAGLGVALASLLAACGSSSTSNSANAASGGRTPLLIWYWGEQEAPGMQKFMEQAVARYNKMQSKVHVTAVLQSSDTLYSAFAAAAQAGKGPDIQYLWGGTQALVDVWLGYIEPLSNYIDESWLSANIPQGARSQTYWGGKQWGMPFYQIGTALPYNKKLFAAAKLDPDNPPTTWSEFMSALEKLKASGVAPLGLGFKDQFLGGWLISYFGQQNFNSIAEAIAPFKGSTPYSGTSYTQWISQIKELVDHGFCNNDVLSINLYQGQNLFPTKKAAIVTSVQPQITSFYRTMGGADTVGVMRAPAFGSGTFAKSFGVPAQVLLITKFSPHKEEAAAFLKYLHTPEMMHLMYKVSGAITPDKKFDPAWLDTDTDKTMLHWQNTMPDFWYQYYYPLQFETNGVDPGLQKLWEPGGSVAGAVSSMQSAIQQWRNQSPAQAQAYSNWQLLS